MSNEMKTARGWHPLLCKWWTRTRPARHQDVQVIATFTITDTDGTVRIVRPAAMEFYVPWWAWPLELIHRAIFGRPRLTLD